MKGAFSHNVSPKIVAVAILLTIAAVQWWWWQALVAKRASRSGPGAAQQGAPGRQMLLYIQGRRDVRVETLAGAPDPGAVDGPGYIARFDGPTGLMVEESGSVLVADTRNHRIRRIAPSGLTTTIAGKDAGFRDGGTGEALFNAPCGLRRDTDGSTLILDAGSKRIRRLQSAGVTTVAAFSTLPEALKAFNASNPALTAKVNQPEGDTGSEDFRLQSLRTSARLGNAYAAADDAHSALFYIWNGAADVIAGTYSPSRRMDGWMDGSGDESRFGRIAGIAAANERTIFVADAGNNCVRRITVPEGE